MGYSDFCKAFESVHICHNVANPFYEITRLYFDGKHGQLFKLSVKAEDEYILELHQSQNKFDLKTKTKQVYEGEDINRGTVILMKATYQFIDGAFTYDEYDTTLRAQLLPGKYLVYVKLDPSEEGLLSNKASLSCYSSHLVKMKKVDKEKLGNIWEKVFM